MADLFWTALLFMLSIHIVASQNGDACGSPLSYENRQLDEKYTTQKHFKNGDKVRYKCALGYTTSSGSRDAYCVSGQWTELELRCVKKKCGSAGEIVNGQFNQEGNTFGDKAYAVCNEGYVLEGDALRVCLNNGWSGKVPLCKDKATVTPMPDSTFEVSAVTCSKPQIINGRFIRAKETFNAGESIVYSCNEGFQLTGSNRLLCDTSGQWSPSVPECKNITCKKIIILNGITPLNNLTFKSNATITCKKGYILKGANVVTCGENSEWRPVLPTCERASQVKVTCSPPAVPNSKQPLSTYRVGQRANIVCQNNYILIGSSEVTCQSNGQWQDLPKCQLLVPAGGCSRPLSPANALLRGLPMDQYLSGASVRFSCNYGYYRASGSDSIQCVNGQWRSSDMRCEKKRCGSAGEIQNGVFHYTGASFGDTVTAECNTGYRLLGNSMRHCRGNGWDGKVPHCQKI